MGRKKIIIVTSRFPFPINKGDKLRIYYQIRDLALFHNIYLVALNTENSINQNDILELEKYCKEVHIININIYTRIFNVIKAFINKEPLQVGYFFSNKAYKEIQLLILKIKPDYYYAQLIRTSKYLIKYDNNMIDYMDAFSKGVKRRIKKFPKLIQPIIRYEAEIIEKYETKIFKYFNTHSIITENDKQYINHPDSNRIKVIPNGVDTSYFKPIENSLKFYDIIFVGNMNYPPNIDAALYICQKIIIICIYYK